MFSKNRLKKILIGLLSKTVRLQKCLTIFTFTFNEISLRLLHTAFRIRDDGKNINFWLHSENLIPCLYFIETKNSMNTVLCTRIQYIYCIPLWFNCWYSTSSEKAKFWSIGFLNGKEKVFIGRNYFMAVSMHLVICTICTYGI